MSTYDLYTTPVEAGTWDVPSTGAARFSWEYDEGRQRLLDLYQRGKDKQWDATKRIDWVSARRSLQRDGDLGGTCPYLRVPAVGGAVAGRAR